MTDTKRPFGNRERMDPEKRRSVIVTAALDLSEKQGLASWSRQDVAETCQVTTSAETVKHYFPLQDDLKLAVLKHENCSAKLRVQGEALGLI